MGMPDRPGHVVVIDARAHRVLRTLETAADAAGVGAGGGR